MKVEYEVLDTHNNISAYELRNQMNRLGRQGYDFIGTKGDFFLFKRKVYEAYDPTDYGISTPSFSYKPVP